MYISIGVPKAVEFGQHLDILVEVLEYGHTVVQNTTCVQIQCQDFSPQVRSATDLCGMGVTELCHC